MTSDYVGERKWAGELVKLLTEPPPNTILAQKIDEFNDLLVTIGRNTGREYVLVLVPPTRTHEDTRVSVGGKPLLTGTSNTITGIIAGIRDSVNEHLHR